MSTLREHLATLRRVYDERGWLTDQFHALAAIMCAGHLAELEALVAETPPTTKGEGEKAAERDITRLPARELTDAELVVEKTRVDSLWVSMFEPDEDGEVFEGHGGSPGEWMIERLDEIATEQRRRPAPPTTPTLTEEKGDHE